MQDEGMIERVARALRQHDCDEVLKRDNVSIPDWESDPDLERREAYRRLARAAIEAMREPPVKIAMDYFREASGDELWRMFIDTALSEKP